MYILLATAVCVQQLMFVAVFEEKRGKINDVIIMIIIIIIRHTSLSALRHQ